MTYYVTGYYQGKSILKREDHLFFLKCEEAEAPTGTMVEVDAANQYQNFQRRNNWKFFRFIRGKAEWKQRNIWKNGVRADVR
ncbi:hypothetical protein DXC31_08460 [Mediterraneibacter gnavus]|uniref:Uncharacterized protein n=1 Tax=Mediterraneibacter gnavus TaxID=33038 RepID=A0A3E4V6E4_MEDGN|nr:hypothetical protein DXC31_08460 [Mediterraneibacter gnavus]